MKRKLNLPVLFLSFLFVLVTIATAQAEIQYTRAEFDLFGVRFEHPDGWKPEVHAGHVTMTSPKSPDLELVLLEVGKTGSSLDSFYNEYKDPEKNESLKEFNLKLTETQTMEVAGMGAYYLKFQSKEKSFGHILFTRDGHQFILALKTPLKEYAKNEPILMKAAQTLQFYKPRQVK